MSFKTQALVAAFVDIAEEQGTDAFIRDLRDQATAKIQAGGGEVTFTTGASLNGKNASQECRMDAIELLAVATQALREFNGTAVSVTYVDFSRMRI